MYFDKLLKFCNYDTKKAFTISLAELIIVLVILKIFDLIEKNKKNKEEK